MDLRSSARAVDPDRYLASLFADKNLQPYLWALIYLNFEIARTREMVTETTLGLIRLQWWRDRLNAIMRGEKNTDHAVLEFLSQNPQNIKFNPDDFDQLIYAREFDLEDVVPQTLEGTKIYACATNLPLLRLFSDVLGCAKEDWEPLARAYGVMGILRAIPFHASQRRCYLPQDKIDLEKLYSGSVSKDLLSLCEDLSGVVAENLSYTYHHAFFRALKVITELHLRHFKKAGYNPFSVAPQIPFKELRVAVSVYKNQ